MLATLRALLRDDGAATLVEYALVVTFIALACVAAAATLGTRLAAAFTRFAGSYPSG